MFMYFYPRPDECRTADEGERPSLCISDRLHQGEANRSPQRDQGEAEGNREEVRGAHWRAAEGNR